MERINNNKTFKNRVNDLKPWGKLGKINLKILSKIKQKYIGAKIITSRYW